MKTEKEKMLSGEYYLANDETLVKERLACKSLLKLLNIDGYVFVVIITKSYLHF